MLLSLVLLSLLLAACATGGSNPAPATTPAAPASSTAPPASAPTTRGPAPVAADWPTYHRDGARTGVSEAGPGAGRARVVWASADLGGAIYGEPLVAAGRVLVATEGNSVAALDLASGRTLWKVALGPPVPGGELPCGNIDPVGITSTPVVDPATGRLLVVAFLAPRHHELIAIDPAAGRVSFRRTIDPPGSDPLVQLQRAALIVGGGRVYVGFGGRFGDCGDYHGHVMAAATDGSGPLLHFQVPTEREGAIWAPSGPAIDSSGRVYVATGNGSSTSQFDHGNSVLRLGPDLRLQDTFAPANWVELNQNDTDLASVGPALVGDGQVFAVGKEGVGYLLDGSHLGGIGGQLFTGRVCDGGAYGGTAYRPPLIYVPCQDGLVALRLESGPSFRVAWRSPSFSAGAPVVAGGSVWVIDLADGVLRAFDAASGQPMTEVEVGQTAHFASPTPAGRLMLVATGSHVRAVTTG